MVIRNYADDKDIVFVSDDGSGNTETYFYLDGSISSGDPFTVFPDSSRLAFGTNLELRFVHDGSNSYISQTGTGNLYIQNFNDDKDIVFQCDDGSGSVETYFYLDGSLSSGNPFTVFPDNSRLGIGTGADLHFYHDGTDSVINNTEGNLFITNYANDKSIYLRTDDASGGITNYLQCRGDREVIQHHRGVEYALTAVSNSDYTVTSGDYCILMHSLSGSGKTVTIPTAQRNAGRVLIIKERDGYASSYNITIDPESSVTIDGSATYVISTNKGSVTLISDGSNWFVV